MPKPPLMLRDSFCMMLAEGALEWLHEKTPALDAALKELEGDRYHELVCELADGFKRDYLIAVKPDPDDPEPDEKVTSIR